MGGRVGRMGYECRLLGERGWVTYLGRGHGCCGREGEESVEACVCGHEVSGWVDEGGGR